MSSDRLRAGVVALRLVMTAVGLVGCLWSSFQLQFAVQSFPVVHFAHRLDAGAAPELTYLLEFQEKHDLERLLATCEKDYVRSVSTIRLTTLDASLAYGNVLSVDRELARAAETLRMRLVCSPADGEAWLRLAMVLMRQGGPTSEALDALRLSYWTAPNEFSVIRPRIRFASRLYIAGIQSVADDLEGDIRDLVLWGRKTDLEALVLSAPSGVEPLYRQAVMLASDRRRELLKPIFEERGFEAGL